MQKEFDMIDLGNMKYFLGIEIHQSANGIFVGQQKYAIDIIQKFIMTNFKSADTPIFQGTKLSKEDVAPSVDSTLYKSLVGSLLYLTTTRPDIMFVASFVSRFMQSPKITLWKVSKMILRYIAGTIDYGLFYTHSENCSLSGYIDNDYAGSLDDRKSTSGYVFHLGTNLIMAFFLVNKNMPLISFKISE